MSKLTLDEAIKHCLEVAEHNEYLHKRGYAGGCNSHDCLERAEIHRQLADWLTELKERRAANVQPVISGDNCIVCGRNVHKDDVYYDVNGGTICEACMNTKCKCKNGRSADDDRI